MPAAFFAWATTFIALFSQYAGSIVGRVLVSLGIGTLTVFGLESVLSSVTQSLLASLGGVGGTFGQVIDACGLPWLVSSLASALTTKFALKGITSGALTSWFLKRSF